MPLLYPVRPLPTLCSSSNPNPNRRTPSLPRHPPLLLRFKTSHRQNVRYLKTLGVDPPSSPESLHWILSIIEYLKSRGFSDSDFPRLASNCPQIFSSATDPDRTLAPVFAFLATDLSASPQEALSLVLRCPELLVSSVEFRLRPTADFLRGVGLKMLKSPTKLNAHLLSSPVEKLVAKVRFLESAGLSYEEAALVCARCPAIFGYSVENNLRPKVEHLVGVMGRPVEEVKRFPQYFGFSLERRIAPRHRHLEERGIRVSLLKMLVWSEEKFYAKWK